MNLENFIIDELTDYNYYYIRKFIDVIDIFEVPRNSDKVYLLASIDKLRHVAPEEYRLKDLNSLLFCSRSIVRHNDELKYSSDVTFACRKFILSVIKYLHADENYEATLYIGAENSLPYDLELDSEDLSNFISSNKDCDSEIVMQVCDKRDSDSIFHYTLDNSEDIEYIRQKFRAVYIWLISMNLIQ
jgi:hypothetical protein